MPEPGWTPPHVTRTDDDCMRMCFSCITGIHPRKLRYIDPKDERIAFWDYWRILAVQKGYRLTRVFNAEYAQRGVALGPWPFSDDTLWIAGVESFLTRGASHAVVMQGQQLYYDCSEVPRSRRPTRINYGFMVTPLAG